MTDPDNGDVPEEGKAWNAIKDIALQAGVMLAAEALADATREFIAWLTS